ncbi:MAG: VWA domain-containing protein [Treponema sp.]|nr:VWA domain-containing protein [Treponema sp.]
MGKSFFCFLFFIILIPFSFLHAQDLSLSPDDLLIELRPDGGYHLFIRYKPDISSVLLTETTRETEFYAENYAYRTAERNDVNGNEIRLIDGRPIPASSSIYSLVSSTPVRHPVFGWAYHIYIPTTLYYGYPDRRHGEVQVGDGTYLNVRAFYYAYADYRGPFLDNPFMLRITQERAVPENTYLPETIDAFTQIAGSNTRYSTGPADTVEQVIEILDREKGNDVDIVVVLDVTGSMRPYFDAIRAELIPMLEEMVAEFDSFRIGMVFFKDYGDEFVNRVFPFTTDFAAIRRNINSIRVGGGGDIPEAVFEALYAGAMRFSWAADSRIMILIGDAPPHPRPRGSITKQMVDREVERRGIDVHAIILPQ